MTTCSEAEEWLEAYRNGEKKTTSCCPGFVNMIRKHYPDLADMISTTVSPMCAVSRMIKAKDPDAVTVFVGPCVAKKSEVADKKIEGNADYALNYKEILAIMKAKDVELEPAENTYQDSTIFGKFYGNSGGVTYSVLEYMKETEPVSYTHLDVYKRQLTTLAITALMATTLVSTQNVLAASKKAQKKANKDVYKRQGKIRSN